MNQFFIFKIVLYVVRYTWLYMYNKCECVWCVFNSNMHCLLLALTDLTERYSLYHRHEKKSSHHKYFKKSTRPVDVLVLP